MSFEHTIYIADQPVRVCSNYPIELIGLAVWCLFWALLFSYLENRKGEV